MHLLHVRVTETVLYKVEKLRESIRRLSASRWVYEWPTRAGKNMKCSLYKGIDQCCHYLLYMQYFQHNGSICSAVLWFKYYLYFNSFCLVRIVQGTGWNRVENGSVITFSCLRRKSSSFCNQTKDYNTKNFTKNYNTKQLFE